MKVKIQLLWLTPESYIYVKNAKLYVKYLPLREQSVMSKVPSLVHLFVIVSILGLDSVRTQQHSRFWGTVVLIIQDGLFHLAENV